MSRRVALLPGLAYRSGILEKQSWLQFRISDCELRIVRRASTPVPFSVAGYRERFLFGSVKPKKATGEDARFTFWSPKRKAIRFRVRLQGAATGDALFSLLSHERAGDTTVSTLYCACRQSGDNPVLEYHHKNDQRYGHYHRSGHDRAPWLFIRCGTAEL
jgi:hypothetical protein